MDEMKKPMCEHARGLPNGKWVCKERMYNLNPKCPKDDSVWCPVI
jgi:hypothetical protein